MARTVALPAASRVMTSGGTGAGGPSMVGDDCARISAAVRRPIVVPMSRAIRRISSWWAGCDKSRSTGDEDARASVSYLFVQRLDSFRCSTVAPNALLPRAMTRSIGAISDEALRDAANLVAREVELDL